MKRLDGKYILIIILTIIVIVLGIINSSIKKDNLNFIERFAKDTSYVVSKIVSAPINFVKNKVEKHNEKENIYKKYKELKEKYDSLNYDEAKIDELNNEIKELRKVLDLKHNLVDYTYLNATIVNRDVGYWHDTITLNKGSKSGVEKDMAVITSDGLIGKISKTSALTSTVKLLTSNDLNMKISVKIKVNNDYLYGLLTGYDVDKKCYILEGLANNIEIPLESTVTTTGMSEIFPSGILIGTISEIGTDNFDLAKIIYVKTNVNYDSLRYVTILKRNYK